MKLCTSSNNASSNNASSNNASSNNASSVSKKYAAHTRIEMEELLQQGDSWQSFVRDAMRLADIVNPADAEAPANYHGLFESPNELTPHDLSFLGKVLRTVLFNGVPPNPQQSRLKFKQDECIFIIIGAYGVWSIILFAYLAYSGSGLGFLRFFATSYISFFGIFISLRWLLTSLSLFEDVKSVFHVAMQAVMKLKNNLGAELTEETSDDEERQERLTRDEGPDRDRARRHGDA